MERAESLTGTVPRRRTDFACVKTVLVGVERYDVGVRTGVDVPLLIGVKRDTVRLAEEGVNGRPFLLATHQWSKPFFALLGFLGVTGAIFSTFSLFSVLGCLDRSVST